MEKINLYLAFIVRMQIIKILVLSQNANGKAFKTINKRQKQE
jgi:hypothetical protein